MNESEGMSGWKERKGNREEWMGMESRPRAYFFSVGSQ